MGIQDRDYWREWSIENSKQPIDPTHWREDELRSSDSFAKSDSTPAAVEKTLKAWTKLFISLAFIAAFGFGLRAWLQHKAFKQMEAIAMQAEADLRMRQEIAAHQALEVSRKLQAKKDTEQSQLEQRIAQRELAERNARAETDRRNHKEAAWRRYYKRSPSCERDPATVDCANEHIRAQRAFDAQYKG